jgi:three-Cys-motif partner protein
MPLGFVGDAISLSGLAGTKLKCDVIGEYYPFWWGITSGGKKSEHRLPTTIVELDAATGEVYIEDSKETVLGSAGHALELKAKTPQIENLKLILIERNPDCYSHLKNVIRRRWPNISIKETDGPISSNTSNIYLLNMTLDDALEKIGELELGNAIFFFDPLRSVEFATIDKVASKRMTTFYKTGTEFIIFIFTSDWFLGRDEFAPLPRPL